MNTKTFFSLLAMVSICVVVPVPAQEAAGEKASEAWDATKKTTKKAAKEVAATTKKAADKVEKAVTKPSGPQQKVDVGVGDHGLSMPSKLQAGNTLFTVNNSGDLNHTFEITGPGLKGVSAEVGRTQTRTIQLDLKPGTYVAGCNAREHQGKEAKQKFTVQ